MDLLGMSMGGEQKGAEVRNAQPAAAATSTTDDLMSLFDTGSSSAPAMQPQSQGQPAAAAPAMDSDPFGMMGMGGGMGGMGGGDLLAPQSVTKSYGLSPATLASTAEFGGLWGQHAAERQLSLQSAGVRSPDEFMKRIRGKLNGQAVEAIHASTSRVNVLCTCKTASPPACPCSSVSVCCSE
jgi:hypothetical protein